MGIAWKDEFSTGIPAVDDQHRRLFQMLNDLEHQLRRGEATGKMMEIVHGLAQYATEHFSFEESCMQQCACPVASVNKMAHKRFGRMVDNTLREVGSQPPPRQFFENLHREVEDWIRNHICTIDVQMQKYAKSV